MAAAALAVFLPAKSPAKPLSPDEASLVQGVHALMQRQDMLQTRIRVVEAVLSPRIKKEGTQEASYLSPAQKNSLKAWLRTIVEEEDGQVRDIPVVKVEEVENDESFIQPKEEETTLESQTLRLPKAESVDPMDSVEESYATAAQVVIKRSSSEESLLSPTLSRSSSSSSPIDTPTPAMRRPMSMELASTTAAQLREMLNEEEDTSLDLDQPLNKRHDLTNRLTQSLGPSGLVPQRDLLFEVDGPQNEKPHRRSFSMYGVIPGIREPEVVDDRADELSEISVMKPNSPPVGNTSMPWLEDNRVQVPADSSPISASTNLQPDQDEGSKPGSTSPDQASQSHYYDSAPLFGQSDDDGWTTVLSKKSRNKIQ